MKYKIAYINCFFGNFNNYFQLWIRSAEANPNIDFIIFTDNNLNYSVPHNVHIVYCSFDDIVARIKKKYDFEISLESPYRLCDFKIAYGDIFKEELQIYDFWGICDLDQVWGKIDDFITDDILEKYMRIGFQGHSSIFRNCQEMNELYKESWNGELFYKKAFSENKTHFFDEWASLKIMEKKGYPCYKVTNFANPTNLYWHFYLTYFDNEMDYKNKHQIFWWNRGKLFRIYLDKNGQKQCEEFMYIHLISRIMKNKLEHIQNIDSFIITPDAFIEENTFSTWEDIPNAFIKKSNKKSLIKYLLWWHTKEKNWKNVLKYIVGTLRPRIKILYENGKKII